MPRVGLNTPAVVGAASVLADEVGWDALTLALLADRVGVRVPSLYKHVASLDALRGAVTTSATVELAHVLGAATVGVARGEALRRLCDAYRGFAHDHPGRYAATQRAASVGDAWRAASDDVLRIVLAVLAGYDIAGDDAIDAARAVRAALHGFAALEATGGFGLPRDVDRSFARLVDGLDGMLADWTAARE